MEQYLQIAMNAVTENPRIVLLLGLGLGVLSLVVGLGSMVADKNPAADRIAASNPRRAARRDAGLLRAPDHDPTGVWKAFLPTNMKERTELSRKLAQAGFNGPGAVRNFTLARVLLGLVLPGFLLSLLLLARIPGVQVPFELAAKVSQMTDMRIFQTLTVLIAAGYFLPLKWLQSRVNERRLRIEQSFPNALDLMQVSVEAGLGFDAAMTRVGNELAEISPEIAFEFLTVQRQVQAGRDRDAAMQDMVIRTDVENIRSFAAVVSQSIQFGTSMSEALTAYAAEMREYREMKAQEMANKLPVKMSGVLASLMLPALVLITIGPVVIRYVRFFGG